MKMLSALLLCLLYSCHGMSQSFEGRWSGDLQTPQVTLPLVFSFEQEEQKWSGTMQSPKQSPAQIPFSNLRIEGDSVFVEIVAAQISFQGELSADGKEITGIFQQGPLRAPMTLARATSDQTSATPARPQAPQPPYPYDTTEVRIPVGDTDVQLAGTITRPKQGDKFPAVILVTGSGPQNRDEEIAGHKPFKVLADYLTRHDIVVLRYDDRGVAESTGNFTSSTIADFSKDAMAALTFLKNEPDVDPEKVGIIGHSEGGLIGLLLAGQRFDDLNFVVSLAGPAIAIDSLMVLQLYSVGKSIGMSEEELEKVRPINRRNFAIVKSDVSDEQAQKLIAKNMESVTEGNAAALATEIETLLLPPFRYFMRIDPIPFVQNIQAPVFAAFGSKDVQVPHAENLESLTDNLPRNPKNLIKTYVGLNHLFQPADTGGVYEYSDIETTIDENVMQDIAEWIRHL